MAENKVLRCGWLTEDPLYIKYHDEEWGIPQYNSFALFEMLCLEGQQAGLSWLTILKKRESYRKCFFNFEPHKVSKLTEKDVDQLLKESGIIRHKGKIESIINNAKCYVQMENNNENFSDFIWSFVNKEPIVNHWKHYKDVPSETAMSIALSKSLKRKGFKFVGSKICYAFMQACGLVNDHVITCIRYNTKHSD
ncbi:DNA-3-methyladenine glycosylase 1-like [Helicoverpa zea]|uniref:DNA-3-methyladenine glycosylase 1-like n=1 Tax=Helicoverpa zea TaxID=7113 RepID=UPI001F587DD2|nr:DNA-3-methyladenine glycosylase 1-like [Helicoverpa zea]